VKKNGVDFISGSAKRGRELGRMKQCGMVNDVGVRRTVVQTLITQAT